MLIHKFYFKTVCSLDLTDREWTLLPQVTKWSGKIIFLQGQGKVREFHFKSGKIEIFERSQGKGNLKSIFVHFTSMNHVLLVEYCS